MKPADNKDEELRSLRAKVQKLESDLQREREARKEDERYNRLALEKAHARFEGAMEVLQRLNETCLVSRCARTEAPWLR